ncbi:toll/interleukin-1 receptor domain-containing protein [Microcystis aeruginosa BLCCF158]|uniref:Toll/interleukin-1 receptor domain-containing protein n=1 Tax=Microcystis aeruginosa BLCC-F158 TaxID=2755316 RepID=A0A841UTN3_MICAE|nr:toll/interleukin-1 receptor domain-containing protein [Microcystis aeruginosa]MBC1193912.1 toll/interleukin-1 receptor domain-containing protein [Microcystis aeruginosa BLCC-F158]
MKVFISHAFTEAQLAKRVADSLREDGFQVWDPAEILPGENWANNLAKALQEAEAMIVLLTPESLKSFNVGSDISYAIGEEKYQGRIIPVIASALDNLDLEHIPWILKKFPVIFVPNLEQDNQELKEITQALKNTTSSDGLTHEIHHF